MDNYQELANKYLLDVYHNYDILVESGEGVYLFDDKKNKYLDFTSGIGVNVLGYQNQKWLKAIIEQAIKITHCSNLYLNKTVIELASILCQKTQMNKVFFANSGTEANEGAIKIARKWGNINSNGQKNKIITLNNSFHGRTYGALSATGQTCFQINFEPLLPGFIYLPINDLNLLKNQDLKDVCAIMIEIIQGESGVEELSLEYLLAIQQICLEQNILLIIDEVQTGIGRTGKLFAYEHYGLKPDLITCGKGLANGLPLAAILVGEKCQNILKEGDHGSTFGGNILACSGAKVVLSYLDEKFLAEISFKGNYIKNRIKKMKNVKTITGKGLMLGIEFDGIEIDELIKRCREKNVLFLKAKNKLRLLPPLIIGLNQIDEGLRVLNEILESWEA